MPAKKKATTKKSEPKKDKGKDPHIEFANMLKMKNARGNIEKKINFIPTGSWVINRLIGDGTLTCSPGGIPRGYMTEIFGDESCGKTTLALHIAKEAQKLGGSVIYADFEHSLRTQFKYIKNIGVDVNAPSFHHMVPDNFEQGVELLGKGLITLKPSLIIVDSVTSMLPKAHFEDGPEADLQIGKHAKLTGNFLNWMNKNLERYDTALVLLNQLRSNIKASQYDPGPKEVTSGGKSIRFFTSLRIQMKVKQKEKVSATSDITGIKEDRIVNQTVQVQVVKNKLDIAFKSGPIYITFGRGINNIRSLIVLAINKKIIKKSSGWYSWEDPNNGKLSFNVNGIQSVVDQLTSSPDTLEAVKSLLTVVPNLDDMKALREDLMKKKVLTAEEEEQLDELNRQIGTDKEEEDGNLNDSDKEALASLNELTANFKDEEDK